MLVSPTRSSIVGYALRNDVDHILRWHNGDTVAEKEGPPAETELLRRSGIQWQIGIDWEVLMLLLVVSSLVAGQKGLPICMVERCPENGKAGGTNLLPTHRVERQEVWQLIVNICQLTVTN